MKKIFAFRFNSKRAVSPHGDQEEKIRGAGWNPGTKLYCKINLFGPKHENYKILIIIDPDPISNTNFNGIHWPHILIKTPLTLSCPRVTW